jgi:predicted short-subunit dehydrogenase-like oxidoreductase (DUF2520 family)
MATINLVGAGRVGRTLGRLWQTAGCFDIGDVLTSGPASAADACAFIGAGRPVATLADMRAADVWLFATPDGRIAAAVREISASGLLRAGDIVAHCSGALRADEMPVTAARASMHPLKSFAEPAIAVTTFGGTYCTAEGDRAALDVLVPAFEAIGGRVTEIRSESKTLYHAASVIVSNDLVALMEAGLRCYEQAGFERDTAREMMAPLVRETLENVLKLDTVKALTGPVVRGDAGVIEKQLAALANGDPLVESVYRELGRVAVEIARERGQAGERALAAIAALFDRGDEKRDR